MTVKSIPPCSVGFFHEKDMLDAPEIYPAMLQQAQVCTVTLGKTTNRLYNVVETYPTRIDVWPYRCIYIQEDFCQAETEFSTPFTSLNQLDAQECSEKLMRLTGKKYEPVVSRTTLWGFGPTYYKLQEVK